MQSEDGKKVDSINTWNNTQVFFVRNLAMAYANLMSASCFLAKLGETKHSVQFENKQALESAYLITCYDCILEDKGTFLLHGYLSTEQVEMVQELQLEQYALFKNYALNIVDSFYPHDDLLDSMIAPADADLYGSVVKKLQQTHPTMPDLKFEKPILP